MMEFRWNGGAEITISSALVVVIREKFCGIFPSITFSPLKLVNGSKGPISAPGPFQSILRIVPNLGWTLARRPTPEQKMYVLRKICWAVSLILHPSCYEPWRYLGALGQGLKENKEIFHLSLNMGAHAVAQAHKQCEAGTVAVFQSGTVAKTQTWSLQGVEAAGFLKLTQVHRGQSSMKGQLTRRHLWHAADTQVLPSSSSLWRCGKKREHITVREVVVSQIRGPLRSRTNSSHREYIVFRLNSSAFS